MREDELNLAHSFLKGTEQNYGIELYWIYDSTRVCSTFFVVWDLHFARKITVLRVYLLCNEFVHDLFF